MRRQGEGGRRWGWGGGGVGSAVAGPEWVSARGVRMGTLKDRRKILRSLDASIVSKQNM